VRRVGRLEVRRLIRLRVSRPRRLEVRRAGKLGVRRPSRLGVRRAGWTQSCIEHYRQQWCGPIRSVMPGFDNTNF
jgi:hypothetical protein